MSKKTIGYYIKLDADKTPKQDELNKVVAIQFGEILRRGVEQHLGRAIDFENDPQRLSCNIMDDGTEYRIDDVVIGKLTTKLGLLNDDFIQNKITYVISFKPVK